MCLCTPLVDMLPLQEGGLNGIFLMHTVFLCTLICQTYKVNIQTILNDCESNIACNITQGVLVCFPVSFTLHFEVLRHSDANSP